MSVANQDGGGDGGRRVGAQYSRPDEVTAQSCLFPDAFLDMSNRDGVCRPVLVAACLLCAAHPLSAQTATPAGDRMSRLAEQLARGPNIAGYPTQERRLSLLLTELAAAGMDTSRTRFRAYVPHPRSSMLARVSPYPGELPMVELRVGDDSVTFGGIWPTMVTYTRAADVTGPVVYANRGTAADYRTLESLRVDPAGALVLARFGACAPWSLVAEAERRGALGLLLYTDPVDDGYVRGDFYPDGRMRHPDAMRRLSVRAEVGDPSAGGTLPESAMRLPRIPVASVGYKHANQLLQLLRAPNVPDSWQGGLPFRYHAGLGEVRARLVLDREQGDSGYKELANGFAVLPGATHPEELIILGAHHDAFGPGATDNGSGLVAAVEVAHRLAEARRRGWRPARTIVVALWDGSEWGQLGSEAWLAVQPDSALDRVVAYLDLERVAAGPSFVAQGSPLLEGALRAALEGLAMPHDSARSLLDAWRQTAAGRVVPAPGPSDGVLAHEGYGLPVLRVAFEGLDGVRHTGYDTYQYLRRFGDPGLRAHERIVEVLMRLVRRLDADGAAAYSVAALPAAVREVAAHDGLPMPPELQRVLEQVEAVPERARLGMERRLLGALDSRPLRWSRHLLFGTEGSCGDRAVALPRASDARGDVPRQQRAIAAAIGALRRLATPASGTARGTR